MHVSACMYVFALFASADARDPIAVFISQIAQARKLPNNCLQHDTGVGMPGDWVCRGCFDVQFARTVVEGAWLWVWGRLYIYIDIYIYIYMYI